MPRNALSLKRIQNNTDSLERILGLGMLQVPKFQRDYSWKEDQWRDLWTDIVDITKTPGHPEDHYMGYIVLQQNQDKDNVFDIIDGQQRLTTLSLLLLAAIYLVRAEDTEGAGLLYSDYIGRRVPSTRDVQSKIALNSKNRETYEQLCKHGALDKKPQEASNRLLLKAFEFFHKTIGEHYSKDVKAITKFAEDIARSMHFTYITVLRDMNIYKIFQTLNATGKQLSINDLLKNYLFLTIDRQENLSDVDAAELQNKWNHIEKTVGDKNLAKFISVEWNRRNKFARKKELFKQINEELKTATEIYGYLKVLQSSGDLYAKLLTGAKHKYWNSHHRKVSNELRECLECLDILKIKSPYGLMLSALEKMEDAQTLNKLLRIIRIISIRYNGICHKQANKQEVIYSELANEIYHGRFSFDAKTKKKFAELYPSDEEFISEFKNLEVDNSSKAKYILLSIERHLDPKSLAGMEKLQLEHILPRKPTLAWERAVPDHASYVDRLGNMTIVSGPSNRGMSNKPFAEKKKELAKTHLALNEQVCCYPNWDAGIIESFQGFLAKKAPKVWDIDWQGL